MSLPNHKNCCGCSACRSICPTSAIAMAPDNEGFLQPVIDKTKCVHCGKCEKVCPVLHHGKPRKPLAVYAAKAKDDELRAGSASGGIFTLLALDVLKRGGVVFGAGFDHTDWRVIHKAAHNEEELDDLRGSKYVQSDVGDTYKEAKQLLDAGQEILYSGCPCQIAGLKQYLGRDYNNLLTVDLVCHGVMSPLLWGKYISARETAAGAKIVRTLSRRYCAWTEYALAFEFSNASAYSKNRDNDPFMKLFLRFIGLRKSCHHCRFRNLSSGAKLTIGDYTHIAKTHPEMDDAKGTSVILQCCNSVEEQIRLLERMTTWIPMPFSNVTDTNEAVVRDEKANHLRNKLYRLQDNMPFDELSECILSSRSTSLIWHLAWWAKRLLWNHEINHIQWD